MLLPRKAPRFYIHSSNSSLKRVVCVGGKGIRSSWACGSEGVGMWGCERVHFQRTEKDIRCLPFSLSTLCCLFDFKYTVLRVYLEEGMCVPQQPMKVRRQPVGVGSLLSLCGCQGLNAGHQHLYPLNHLINLPLHFFFLRQGLSQSMKPAASSQPGWLSSKFSGSACLCRITLEA